MMVETSSWRCLSVAMILGLLAIVSSVHAVADNGRKATSPASPAASTTSPAVDRESEAVVNRLVQSHLPELTDVLKQLRAVQPREYERAIQDLAKAARKLELAQNRDPRLFDIELELLQAQHRISLLTAKLKVRDSESDRKRLRAAAKRLHDAQVTRAQYDVDVMRLRLARSQQQLDAALARLESRKGDANDEVEKSYRTMLRKAGRDAEVGDSDAAQRAKERAKERAKPKKSPPNDNPPPK